MSYINRMLAFIRFAFYAFFHSFSLKVDLVLATSTPLTIAIPAIFLSKIRRVPFIFEVRDLWPEMPIALGILKNPFLIMLSRMLECFAYNSSSSIIALSPGMKSGIVKQGYPATNIAVIPNISDRSLFSINPHTPSSSLPQLPCDLNNPILLYAGTFGLVNDLDYLVDLAHKLLSLGSNIQILLVGDGACRTHLLKRASSLGVLDVNFFIMPPISKSNISYLFRTATICSCIFLDLPEMRVNSANKFFDALASAKPVFINYGGWMHELVAKYKCGFSSWGISLNSTASALHSHLNDSAWLKSASQSSSRLALDHFDRPILENQFVNVVQMTHSGLSYCVEQIAPGKY